MDKNVYIKIAYWYYNLGLTQDEIARRLSLTRQKVNRIINSLVDLDIVTITVHGFEQDEVELECEIEQAFGLDKCIIATDYGEKETAFYKVMNVAARKREELKAKAQEAYYEKHPEERPEPVEEGEPEPTELDYLKRIAELLEAKEGKGKKKAKKAEEEPQPAE